MLNRRYWLRDLPCNKLEFTTQKLRLEYAAEEQDQLYDEIKEKFHLRPMDESQMFCPINEDSKDENDNNNNNINQVSPETDAGKTNDAKEKSDEKNLVKDDNKSTASQQSNRKKRRK
jgi:hypothetical protein